MIMKISPASVLPKSITLTMLGCATWLSSCASRKKRLITSGVFSTGLSSLTATGRPSGFWIAL